jgi:hypothetical protein
MYVRWQTKDYVRPKSADPKRVVEQVFNAVLVESKRTKDNPNPQQHHIAYLGSCRLTYDGIGLGPDPANTMLWRRFHFWRGALEALAKLNLASEERIKLEVSLAERVRRLTPEEFAGCIASRAQLMGPTDPVERLYMHWLFAGCRTYNPHRPAKAAEARAEHAKLEAELMALGVDPNARHAAETKARELIEDAEFLEHYGS